MTRQSSDESVISMRQYKDRVSEGSPFRDMLSVGARRIGAGFRGKHSPDVIAAAVKRTNFIISNEIIYYVVFAVDSPHIIYFSVSTVGGSFLFCRIVKISCSVSFFVIFKCYSISQNSGLVLNLKL